MTVERLIQALLRMPLKEDVYIQTSDTGLQRVEEVVATKLGIVELKYKSDNNGLRSLFTIIEETNGTNNRGR